MIHSCLATASGKAETEEEEEEEECEDGQREAGSPPRVLGHGLRRSRRHTRRRGKTTEFRGKVEKWAAGWGVGGAKNDRSDKSWTDVRRNEAPNGHSAFRLGQSFHCEYCRCSLWLGTTAGRRAPGPERHCANRSPPCRALRFMRGQRQGDTL